MSNYEKVVEDEILTDQQRAEDRLRDTASEARVAYGNFRRAQLEQELAQHEVDALNPVHEEPVDHEALIAERDERFGFRLQALIDNDYFAAGVDSQDIARILVALHDSESD